MVVYIDDRIEGNDTPLAIAMLSKTLPTIVGVHYTHDNNTIISAIDNPSVMCIYKASAIEYDTNHRYATDKSVFAYISACQYVESFYERYYSQINELRDMKFPKHVTLDNKYDIYNLMLDRLITCS